MKSNGINWRSAGKLGWQFGLIACICVLIYFYIQNTQWKMSGESDKITSDQFASFYLTTPLAKMNNLRGWATCSYSETSPTGYIFFDCVEKPILTDANLYKDGGDTLALSDKFLRQFGKESWSLLHSSDLVCLRMIEGPAAPRRFLLHNRKTTRYFFARL